MNLPLFLIIIRYIFDSGINIYEVVLSSACMHVYIIKHTHQVGYQPYTTKMSRINMLISM